MEYGILCSTRSLRPSMDEVGGDSSRSGDEHILSFDTFRELRLVSTLAPEVEAHTTGTPQQRPVRRKSVLSAVGRAVRQRCPSVWRRVEVCGGHVRPVHCTL